VDTVNSTPVPGVTTTTSEVIRNSRVIMAKLLAKKVGERGAPHLPG
jgi:hypothetical protein